MNKERKVVKLLWLSNDWHSAELVPSQAVSRPYLSPMIVAPFPICITVFHSKLCWTTKKLSLCILHLLCSNVCRLFSMWARAYQGLYAHFINRQKATILHAHCSACKQLYDVLHITFNVSICEKLSLLFYLPARYNNLILICCGFSVELVSDTNMLSFLLASDAKKLW